MDERSMNNGIIETITPEAGYHGTYLGVYDMVHFINST